MRKQNLGLPRILALILALTLMMGITSFTSTPAAHANAQSIKRHNNEPTTGTRRVPIIRKGTNTIIGHAIVRTKGPLDAVACTGAIDGPYASVLDLGSYYEILVGGSASVVCGGPVVTIFVDATLSVTHTGEPSEQLAENSNFCSGTNDCSVSVNAVDYAAPGDSPDYRIDEDFDYQY